MIACIPCRDNRNPCLDVVPMFANYATCFAVEFTCLTLLCVSGSNTFEEQQRPICDPTDRVIYDTVFMSTVMLC